MVPGTDGGELTGWAQSAVNIAVLLIATLGAGIGYFRRPQHPSIEAQVVGGALADRQSMERLTDAIDRSTEAFAQRLAGELEQIAVAHRRGVEEHERLVRVLERMADAAEDMVRSQGRTEARRDKTERGD